MYDDIAEVLEVSLYGLANGYLKHGYRLLSIDRTNVLRRFPAGATMSQSHMMTKQTTFIIGRPKGVPEWIPELVAAVAIEAKAAA